MNYKGYKLIDKIILICRDIAEHEESTSVHAKRKDYQAYLVDPSNKKQLESARYWAKWTEYGPGRKNEETGKWERDYEIKHEPVEFEFENSGFELELLDCAGGSSQGGKLSFWNCLVTKDSNRFIIGINSEMLLDLLKDATFVNGKCQSPLIFITQKGRVGMTVKGSATYQQCIKDKETLSNLKKTQTSKFSFGDKVSTATINEIYLGTITKYYEFDAGGNDRYYHHNPYLNECTITKLKKPIKYHIFKHFYEKESLSDILNDYKDTYYFYLDLKKTCPKRTITGQINLDVTKEDFNKCVMKKIYDFDDFVTQQRNNFVYKDCPLEKLLYYFLTGDTFGLGFEPFELNSDFISMIKAKGIKYVEEA